MDNSPDAAEADAPMSLVEMAWSNSKGPLLDAATEVCSMSKKHRWKPETWWWDDHIKEVMQEKRMRFKVYNNLKKQGQAAEAAKAEYNEAKRVAKRAVWVAKSRAEKEVFDPLSTNDDDFCHLAKQIDHSIWDVVGENCVHNDAGEVALSDDKMKAWVEHYTRLLNIEFEWPSHELPEVPPTAGPHPKVLASLISKALGKMKSGKSAGPSGVVAKMLKATGDDGVELIRQLAEAVFSSGDIPEDWEKSFILNLHKGKGDALDCGNYRGLKLTDQVMKLLEQTLDIHKMVDIDEMQFGFVPGRGTTNTIFIVRQMREKHLAANKPLYFAFVDLKKAFDHVPRKMLWWVLRSVGVEEWSIRVIQGMYTNARSRIRVNGQYSEEFGLAVGVHLGSVLSPLLFILVLEALSREFCTGAPWELLYADDLVIMADSLELCSSKLKAWKAAMEKKGLRVNMSKTKFLISGVGLDVLKDTEKFPYAICRSGVGNNSIQCSRCKLWVHKRCSSLKGRLVHNTLYACPRCLGNACPIDGRPTTLVDIDGSPLEVIPTFPYLGDTLNAGGGCDSAIAGRCCATWGSSESSCPYSHPDTSPQSHMGKSTAPASDRQCSMVVRLGAQMPQSCNDSAKMTVPWLGGSVA